MNIGEPEVTNCFSKIALVIIRENKTKCSICDSETSTDLAAISKTESRHCYNHLAVIIARENEVFDQSARAIFDNHQCSFTNNAYNPIININNNKIFSRSPVTNVVSSSNKD